MRRSVRSVERVERRGVPRVERAGGSDARAERDGRVEHRGARAEWERWALLRRTGAARLCTGVGGCERARDTRVGTSLDAASRVGGSVFDSKRACVRQRVRERRATDALFPTDAVDAAGASRASRRHARQRQSLRRRCVGPRRLPRRRRLRGHYPPRSARRLSREQRLPTPLRRERQCHGSVPRLRRRGACVLEGQRLLRAASGDRLDARCALSRARRGQRDGRGHVRDERLHRDGMHARLAGAFFDHSDSVAAFIPPGTQCGAFRSRLSY